MPVKEFWEPQPVTLVTHHSLQVKGTSRAAGDPPGGGRRETIKKELSICAFPAPMYPVEDISLFIQIQILKFETTLMPMELFPVLIKDTQENFFFFLQ